jgi:hypothetical protein
MAFGLVLPFPPTNGLTQNDLKRLYGLAADHPGAQISVLVGGDRRISAILALADHYLWIARDGEAVSVRQSISGFPADQLTPNGDLLDALQIVLSAEDEPPQSQTACGG